MHSPISRRAVGECNAISVRGLGKSEIDFRPKLENRFFGGSHKPA